jgi:ribonuclease P protein component
MDETFGKAFKLCSKKSIDMVFSKGKKCQVFPFLAFVLYGENESPSLQYMIAVPKKKIKKAHDRNYIKRCIREGLRKNKKEMLGFIEEKDCNAQICIVYLWDDVLEGPKIEQNIKKLISKVCVNK